MKHIEIRKARVEDIPNVRLLMEEIIPQLEIYSVEAREQELLNYPQPRLEKICTEGQMVIAEDNDGICGFCFGYDDDMLIWLSWFIVHPRARNQGIGHELIKLFIELCRLKTHKIWCDTRSNNDVSMRILKKAGFEKICTIKEHWYKQDFTLWQNRLNVTPC